MRASSEQDKVECCFGVWKRRFPILSIGISVAKDNETKADYYIVAAVILHNIATLHQEGEPPVDPEVVEPDLDIISNTFLEPSGSSQDARYQVRRDLVNNYFATLL